MTTENRSGTAGTDVRAIGRAWQDGVQAMVSGYGDQVRRMAELGAGFYGMRWLDQGELREQAQKIAEGAREVASARAGIASEWLRAPLWLTGAASPRDLQARYFRLFEAQRDLARTWLDASLGLQRALIGATTRVTETAREAVDAQVQSARRVANDAATAQEAATDLTRRAASTTRETAQKAVNSVRENSSRVVEQAREAAGEAAEQAGLAPRPIKGNLNSRGEKIYHLPGQSSYERTQAEETFATEAEAQAAGYRRADTPGAGQIKGNVNARGEKIYHVPGQANYDRIEADALFQTEQEAEAAGFRPSQR